MTSLLEIHGISKAFFGVPAVSNVSLSVSGGQVVGLIGQNGAGKSTLMNLIGGVVVPDQGNMVFKNHPYHPYQPADAQSAGIAFIHQELNLFSNLTIAENIFISNFPRRGPFRTIDRAAIRQRTRALMESVGLDLSPETPIDRISPGERQLVEIAKAIYQDAALIIFDEPTTSLTARETGRLFDIIRQLTAQGKALIYISHILPDILTLADVVAVMRDGHLVGYDSVEKFDIASMIRLMVGRSIEQLYPPRTSIPTNQRLLELTHVSSPGVVKDINLSLHQGEILGIFGLMGSGRTELARMIFGIDPFESGAILIDGQSIKKPSARKSIQHRLAFVTEDRREEGLLMNIDLANNIGLVALPTFARTPIEIIDRASLMAAAREMVNTLQLRSGNIEQQTAKSLSGGNQQKVVIAKWLLSQPAIFMMDEPTRGIDVGAKYEIYTIINHIAAEGSAILIISSELEELMGICDRILVMSRGEIYGEFKRAEFNDERILRAAFREQDTPLVSISQDSDQTTTEPTS